MKMVAAAKLKRAQDKVTELRPYSNKLNEILLTFLTQFQMSYLNKEMLRVNFLL